MQEGAQRVAKQRQLTTLNLVLIRAAQALPDAYFLCHIIKGNVLQKYELFRT
jgi:hypothetical protein